MKLLPLWLSVICLFAGAASVAAQDFYGSGIQNIQVVLPASRWDILLDSLKNVNPENRLLGSVTVNGIRYDSIGIRYKGNSSYFRTRKSTIKKLPVNIKLDYKRKGQTLREGQNAIKLSNAFLDPSFIRDPLGYEVVRRYMPAPRCNFSRLTINQTYFGLYVNTESIDANFLLRHFGSVKGSLIKCDPDNWKRVRSQSGCPKGENASLAYLGDNPECYEPFYEVEQPSDWYPLLNLIRVLNKSPERIETVLNVDQALWMLALNNVMVNLDSYNGSLSHNYYLWFDSTGVGHPLIWDLNMAFGGWRRNFSFEEMTDEQLITFQPLADFDNPKRPLLSKLLKQPLYRKVYLCHLKTIAQDYLSKGQLLSRAQQMQKEIDGLVKTDSLKLYTYPDFQRSLDQTMTSGIDHIIGIRQLMEKRGQFLSKHPLLNKPAPTITEVNQSLGEGQLTITARLSTAIAGWLCHRQHNYAAFQRTAMWDDGSHGDGVAGDGIYTAQLDRNQIRDFYLIAEGMEAATTFPERASRERIMAIEK
jgi:hypothetical protein